MNYKTRYMVMIALGAAIMVGGFLMAFFTPMTEKIMQSGIITMGMVMIMISIIKLIRLKDEPVKDELTRKIADRSAAYSWVLTLLILLLVFWLNHFEIITFSVNSVITITYLTMVATMIGFQQYYWRKGDVE